MPPDKSQKTEAPTPQRDRRRRARRARSRSRPTSRRGSAMLAAIVLLQMTIARGGERDARRAPGHGHGDRAPEPGRRDEVRRQRGAGPRSASSRRCSRDDGDRRRGRPRPGRAAPDGEEAEARLRPAQRVQGHQAHVRHAGVVGAREVDREDHRADRDRVAGGRARGPRALAATRTARCRASPRSPRRPR